MGEKRPNHAPRADVAAAGQPGARFRRALEAEKPLQIAGTINAYVALLAKRVGYRAIYLSGAGVANSSYGLPDLGITSLENVLEDARRITSAVDLPLLVDIDTGFGEAFGIARTVKEMIRAGVAAVHLEDQVAQKRCGHRPGKQLVPASEMVDRIRTTADARTDPSFVIMARTDAYANEGLTGAMERAALYRDAGADMIFAEAFSSLEDYRALRASVGIPILANITEFGQTPLFTTAELASAGVDMALYPLSANRAMNAAALAVLSEIREKGTQTGVLDAMQTRADLYEVLGYMYYEKKLDALFGRDEEGTEDG